MGSSLPAVPLKSMYNGTTIPYTRIVVNYWCPPLSIIRIVIRMLAHTLLFWCFFHVLFQDLCEFVIQCNKRHIFLCVFFLLSITGTNEAIIVELKELFVLNGPFYHLFWGFPSLDFSQFYEKWCQLRARQIRAWTPGTTSLMCRATSIHLSEARRATSL